MLRKGEGAGSDRLTHPATLWDSRKDSLNSRQPSLGERAPRGKRRKKRKSRENGGAGSTGRRALAAHLGLEADAVLEGVLVVQGDAEVVPVVHQVVLGLGGHGGPAVAGQPRSAPGAAAAAQPPPRTAGRPRGGIAPPRSAEEGRSGGRGARRSPAAPGREGPGGFQKNK